MISLKHISNCRQVLNPKNLDLSLKRWFITDTRAYRDQCAFVAIPGLKVNPLNLIADLLKKGCDTVFYQESSENNEIVKKYQSEFPQAVFIAVKDSVNFIQEIAHLHIKEWIQKSGHTLFAISGSNGKTTHKEMLSHIMENIIPGKVVSTQKNNNNHLGVPLTLFGVSDETEFVVLELGSNHPGEIKFLCDLALPNAGLTTNIGATHLEFFGTEEAVFEEEGYLYYSVRDNTQGKGFFLINDNDSFLKRFADTQGSVRFGTSSSANVSMSFFPDGAKLGNIEVHNPNVTGNHNKSNLVTCAFIAAHFYPQLTAQIVSASATFKPTPNRSQWIDVKNSKIYLDAYNANPSSMKVALEGFKGHLIDQHLNVAESCIVLGDMNELGEKSPEYHQEIGQFAKELGFKNIIFVGRFASAYVKGCGFGETYPTASEFKKKFQQDYLGKIKFHFIKGSRSLQLESLFDIT